MLFIDKTGSIKVHNKMMMRFLLGIKQILFQNSKITFQLKKQYNNIVQTKK